ncbi:MAG TPA: VOC family protein [Steroidobacteraceae bacterium]|jgi:predicted 3-demethylubiquinone-9 3-methyltransferase (glyoxalase superfamily)|nr:VOC family protein [Steroidobacteraceae bacterium]
MLVENVICLWYDGAAQEAVRFYAKTFPDSALTTVFDDNPWIGMTRTGRGPP